MGQKTICTIRLCFGVLISIFVFNGCKYQYTGGDEDTYTHIYKNQTQHDIKIEKHRNNERSGIWDIESNGTIKFLLREPSISDVLIIDSDSIRIVFGDKELWYRSRKRDNEPYSIYNLANYTDVKKIKLHTRSTYTFTKAHLDLATEIKK